MSTRKNKSTDSSTNEISRRKFLKSAATGSAVIAATAVSLPAGGASTETRITRKTSNPFYDILRRYGSELGDLREAK